MFCRVKELIYGLVLINIISMSAFAADIELIGAGARSVSLGRAYAGELGYSNSIFINPAGLSGIGSYEISSMFANFAGDVNYSNINAAFPAFGGVIGVGYLGASVGDMAITTIEANGRIGASGGFNYNSDIIALSYARKVNDNLALGAGGKYYNSGNSLSSNGSGMALDLGAVYQLNEKLTIGLAGLNLLCTGMQWNSGATDQIPYTLNAGIIYKLNDVFECLIDADKVQNQPVLFKAGTEMKIWKSLDVRIGAEEMTQGSGQNYFNYTAGVGLTIGQLTVDYAYYRDMLVTDNSTHFISISIAFPVETRSGAAVKTIAPATFPTTQEVKKAAAKPKQLTAPQAAKRHKVLSAKKSKIAKAKALNKNSKNKHAK